jgi:hypothetical protein
MLLVSALIEVTPEGSTHDSRIVQKIAAAVANAQVQRQPDSFAQFQRLFVLARNYSRYFFASQSFHVVAPERLRELGIIISRTISFQGTHAG